MSWKKEKKEHPWTTVAQAKRIASDHAKKRQPYQKRFHKPLFPSVGKTTTVRGNREYHKLYMRRLREIKRATK